MREEMFRIDTYLRPAEMFHFARKDLIPDPPALRHRHNYYELFLVERGACIHWINGIRDVLRTGDLVFMRPSDCHAVQADADLGCRILNVMFRAETAAHLESRYGAEFGGRFFWSGEALPETVRLSGPRLERAVNLTLALRSSLRTLTRIENFLLSILTHVLDDGAAVRRGAPEWLVAACRAAQRPDVFRQGAAGFVRVAGRGHEHVCRQTRAHLGLSPTEYLNRVRIQHAAMLLSSTTRPLTAVAEECGFENMSYFHRRFREHYGTTPGGYRRRRRRDPIQSGGTV